MTMDLSGRPALQPSFVRSRLARFTGQAPRTHYPYTCRGILSLLHVHVLIVLCVAIGITVATQTTGHVEVSKWPLSIFSYPPFSFLSCKLIFAEILDVYFGSVQSTLHGITRTNTVYTDE